VPWKVHAVKVKMVLGRKRKIEKERIKGKKKRQRKER
jgi:hypothetical protein